jgi:hypothetical protein
MTLKKLAKLRGELDAYRGNGCRGISPRDLESFARKLGRNRAKRGSEPNWVSEEFNDLRPVSIPHHSRDLSRFTAGSILDQLEEDIERHEAEFKKLSSRNG